MRADGSRTSEVVSTVHGSQDCATKRSYPFAGCLLALKRPTNLKMAGETSIPFIGTAKAKMFPNGNVLLSQGELLHKIPSRELCA